MTLESQPRPSISSRLVDRQTAVTLAGIGAVAFRYRYP